MSTHPIVVRRTRHAGDTKERLLDAAERFFAERGFEGTSMRAVTQAAGSSVSSANYHFGSKEELLRATLFRRVAPVNRRRIERLDQLEARASAENGALTLHSVIDAFLRPLFETRAERIARGETGEHHRQIAVRLYVDPPELVAGLRHELFGEVNARFAAALARALPGSDAADLDLALQITVGVMVHMISGEVVQANAPRNGVADFEPVLRKMIAYVVAGVAATVSAPSADTSQGERV